MQVNVMTDGGARGNPGPAAAGVVISDQKGKKLFRGGFFLGKATNNVAEYMGFLHGLDAAAALGATELAVFCDSDLIVKQLNGQYKVKNAQLKKLHAKGLQKMRSFNEVTITHVRREKNTQADALVNDALDMQADVSDAVGTAEGLTSNTAPQTMPSESKPDSSALVADLNQKAHFDASEPQRILLFRGEGMFSGLICLEPTQLYTVTGNWRQATVTVIRGAGSLKTDQEEITLKPGTWVHLNSRTTAQLTADANERLVAILTACEE